MTSRRNHRSWPCSLGLVAIAAAGPAQAQLMAVFSEKNALPLSYRKWNGSSWTAVAATGPLADTANFLVLRRSPNGPELAAVAAGALAELDLLIHDGSVWGVPQPICTNISITSQRPFHLDYEQQSGHMLVAYWDHVDASIGYRTWDGATLSLESQLVLPSVESVHWLELFPRHDSDEIMLVALNVVNEVYAAFWNGSGWGAASLLTANAGSTDYETFSFAWEALSGEGVVVYAESRQSAPRYRTWSGAIWSGEFVAPDVGGEVRWLRLDADPVSNTVLLAAHDGRNDINVNAWDGSAWGSVLEVCSDVPGSKARQFDLAFLPGGTNAVTVYAKKNSAAIFYRTWDGATWSGELVGPASGARLNAVAAVEGRDTDDVLVLTVDNANDLNSVRWDGASMTAMGTLTLDIGGAADTEPFAIAPAVTSLRITSWTEVDPDG